MLHQLALATSQTPTLLKEAIISPAQDQLIKKRLDQKAMDLAGARGVDVPLAAAAKFDPSSGAVKQTLRPDIESMRMSQRPATGGAPPVAARTIEKEIQKAHGVVSNSPVKQLRHRTVGKAKRIWGGKGLLGGKWRNRAGIIGGLGALGLGIKTYLDSNKTPQPELAPQAPQQQPTEGPQYMSYEDLYGGYKMGASKYSPDAVTIPKPTALPRVNPLGPGVSSTPTLKPDSAGSPMGLSGSSPGASPSGGSSPKSAGLLKRSDEGVLPLLGLGAGGLGGWALGEKVISPILENKEKNIAQEIARKQHTLQTFQKVRRAAPIGAAAAGALLLAALTAAFAKKQTRQEMQGMPQAQLRPYDPSGAGFYPNEATQMGNFYG